MYFFLDFLINLFIYLQSLQYLANKIDIDRRVVTRWVKDKDAIFASKHKRKLKRLQNKKDRCLCPAMEVLVDQWFCSVRAKNSCVDGDTIRSKAREIYNEVHPFGPDNEGGNNMCPLANAPFMASHGWLHNYCKRKMLSYRRISTTGRELPGDTLVRINDFYVEVSVF